MTETEIKKIVGEQRSYFHTGATLPVSVRVHALNKLKSCIIEKEEKINKAIHQDLGKSAFETYMCETGLVLSELSYMLKHISSYAKEKSVRTPLAQFHSRSYKKPSPYGVTLIMSPWNYPFLLTIDPLVDAIAAGNTAVVKPSAYSPCTSEIIQEIIRECFDKKYVAAVTGGRAENTCLLNEHFDYIFFTGSQAVGKEVMRCASAHLTPVTLELGGKSPCIIERNANLKLAARRVVFGKYLNCGQTCVAPDYVLAEACIKEELLEHIRKEITRQYGEHPLENPSYGKMINRKHFERVCGLIDRDKLVFGGETEEEALRIAPAVLGDVTGEDAVMQEEIFGPVLPVLTVDSMEEALEFVRERPRPLALYLFTGDRKTERRFLERLSFGGGCINDTVIHLATSGMGFGGVGASGMGSYHGRKSFETFSHEKSVVKKYTWLDLPMRYQPYTALKERLVRMFVR